MSTSLFISVLDAVGNHDKYFTWRKDCTGKYGVHPALKVTAALRMLAYGCLADSLDEVLWIGESTVHESLDKFTSAVIAIYGPHYLRLPTQQDMISILETNAQRGFPGMLGSIDCMKWQWKNCPSSWCGAFQGSSKKATVVLEAIATADLNIWHAFIGMSGSSNDLNVLDASPLLAEYMDDTVPRVFYEVNGSQYDFSYYLADGIYSEWKCFVKSITAPADNKQQKFATVQESICKDVERAFGVLQSRFAIVARPSLVWTIAKLKKIMQCCIILHNMTISDEADHCQSTLQFVYAYTASRAGYRRHIFEHQTLRPEDQLLLSLTEKYKSVMNSAIHFKSKSDLLLYCERVTRAVSPPRWVNIRMRRVISLSL